MQAVKSFGTLEKWVVRLPNIELHEPLPSLSQKIQLPMDWPISEEPEPLVIDEVFQATPVFRHPLHSIWPEKGRVQDHYTSEEDSVSSPPPPRALTVETGLVDLYKVLESRDPHSTPVKPASSIMVLPVDYLPTHEGYLPSNIDYLPSQEAPITDPLEELEPQHISLSVFSSSLHPLTSCGEKLTLDQLKMGCGSLML